MQASVALSPTLYKQLLRVFRHVRLQDQGAHMTGEYRSRLIRNKMRLDFDICDWGETYRVNCPFCCDTRFRLSVNYRWAQFDFRTRSRNLQLATCFNEECLRDVTNQRRLHAMVYPRGMWSNQVPPPIKPQRIVAPTISERPALPPGVPLHELPNDHPAIRYLEHRGFSPERLSTERGVYLAEVNDTSRPRLLEPRLIVPIHAPNPAAMFDKRLADIVVGWQARLTSEPSSKDVAKYLTSAGFQKNRYFYGLTSAIRTDGPVIVVEGVTDAWRVGPQAVALLGKTISLRQLDILTMYFSDRPVVVWLDADARQEQEAVRGQIAGAFREAGGLGTIQCAKIPDGFDDPAACTPEQVLEVLAAAAGKSRHRKVAPL